MHASVHRSLIANRNYARREPKLVVTSESGWRIAARDSSKKSVLASADETIAL